MRIWRQCRRRWRGGIAGGVPPVASVPPAAAWRHRRRRPPVAGLPGRPAAAAAATPQRLAEIIAAAEVQRHGPQGADANVDPPHVVAVRKAAASASAVGYAMRSHRHLVCNDQCLYLPDLRRRTMKAHDHGLVGLMVRRGGPQVEPHFRRTSARSNIERASRAVSRECSRSAPPCPPQHATQCWGS